MQLLKELPVNVVIVVYDGVYLLDFCGPLEVFYDTLNEHLQSAFKVSLVGPSTSQIKTHTNTVIHPDCSYELCPSPDVIVIPGGNLNLVQENKHFSEWIKNCVHESTITLSVCTGAFILADLGLLDGLESTTWYGATKMLQQKYPSIKVIKGKRYTDNGQIITTAGVSAGIDGSLHVVKRLLGNSTAHATAKYIEYVWDENA